MARASLAALSVLIGYIFLLSMPNGSRAAATNIATYWGQNADEGRLLGVCNTHNYQIVNIAYLSRFGNGANPIRLSLNGHCTSSTCPGVGSDIKACQHMGIKVLLSIGGPDGSYSLTSADDARQVATAIWNTFLGGTSTTRPFGDAVLDGVDFFIEAGSSQYWDELAKQLKIAAGSQTSLYLSAAPRCLIPDPWLDTAVTTFSFDAIWIRFYNNPDCEYHDGSADNLRQAWAKWLARTKASTVFLGVPAAVDAADDGFIVPDQMNSVLQSIRGTPMYGGVMVWSSYYDIRDRYSNAWKSNA